ncbi:MAG: hypothetical protein OXI93_14755 [Bryobacterales bacterium]|nr:hypothetical protein [Bryobacterales bacterium]
MYRHYDARPLSGVTWASDPRYVPGSHTVRAETVIERDGSMLLIKVEDTPGSFTTAFRAAPTGWDRLDTGPAGFAPRACRVGCWI